MIQVRQRLREREAPLLFREGAAEHDARYLIRRLRAIGYGTVHGFEPFLVVGDQLLDPPVQVVEDGAVSWQDESRPEAAYALQRFQVAGQRVRLRFGPEPDVGVIPSSR